MTIEPIARILEVADREVTCPECGVAYMTAFGRLTCGEEPCMASYCQRKKIKRDYGQKRQDNEALAWRAARIPGAYAHAETHHVGNEHKWQTRRSVRIIGLPGRGKTHAAVALLKDAIRKGARECRFVSASGYLKAVKSTFRKGSRESERDVLDDYVRPDVLVIDDVGTAKNSEYGWGELLSLIEERGFAYKTTIITTNLTMPEIHEMEPRIASRIQNWRVIELTGVDRRAAL